MKKVEVVNAKERVLKPFRVKDFTQNEAPTERMIKINKKELKTLAEDLGLVYDDAQIVFTKKLLNAYLRGKR